MFAPLKHSSIAALPAPSGVPAHPSFKWIQRAVVEWERLKSPAIIVQLEARDRVVSAF